MRLRTFVHRRNRGGVRERRLPPLLAAAAGVIVLAACERPSTDVLGPPDVRLDRRASMAAHAVYGIGAVRRAVPRPCPAPAHREFDFWVGLWHVRDPGTGALRGLSEITSELGGCVVMEEFTAPNGFRSRSLSVYDGETDRWHQSFLSANTTNIRFEGGRVGADMVLTADQLAFDVVTGTVQRREHEVTWSPREDGTMIQTIEVSFGGVPRPTFVNRYEPVASLDPPPPLPLPICDAVPGFRDLDFWVGEWRVAAARGPELGTSEVAIDLSGCLVEENFVGPNGYESRSFLFYDFVTGTWFRTFADRNGEHIELSGGLETGDEGIALVMTGRDRTPDGQIVDLRVTVAPSADGVVQTWETSRDGGESWRTAFTLEFRPAG